MTADQQTRDLYDQFLSLHPQRNEPFLPTLENLQRWAWHIKEASSRPDGDKVDTSNRELAEKVARSRAFSQFIQMPAYMQDRYLKIAGLFPGIQFYACGSRVTGEYIETWSGESIKRLRKQLGKPPKEESDYDVVADIPHGIAVNEMREQLPPWADLLQHGVPPEEKIPIPMWDFSRLPDHEHENVLRLYSEQRWGELMLMHNRYVLSMNVYCCNEAPIIRYFGWAIEKGIIKANDTQTATSGMDQ